MVEIVHPGPPQRAVGHVEAGRSDDMDGDAEAGGEPENVAGILRNVGLVEGERDHWRSMPLGRVHSRHPRPRFAPDNHSAADDSIRAEDMVTMLDWFAHLFDPFVDAPVVRPPDRCSTFFRYFLAPVRGLLAAIVIVSLLTPVTEMPLLVFLGGIVDWATTTPPAGVLLPLRLGARRDGLRHPRHPAGAALLSRGLTASPSSRA